MRLRSLQNVTLAADHTQRLFSARRMLFLDTFRR